MAVFVIHLRAGPAVPDDGDPTLKGAAMIEVSGSGGQLVFDGQYITITRKGFLARATHGRGEKRLHVSQVSAVQWKPAGALVNGFIQFSIGGADRQALKGARTIDASKDENSVVFTKQQQPEFERLRAALDQAIAAQHAPQGGAPSTPVSVADELLKLRSLVEQGLLTQGEFDQQKVRLLSQ
ncbi:DUF4429 domain-containing protein [Streptomyces sp. NPDC048257]|uniref:DUF4429 domain-containing protein n=1 Tax=Streptomyces sp. NPDC048257 TaxID=3365526 RepID=UPI00371966A8